MDEDRGKERLQTDQNPAWNVRPPIYRQNRLQIAHWPSCTIRILPMPPHPGLWTHKNWPIRFMLCVDNFGIKYVGKYHDEHLLNRLRKRYTVTMDWTGTLLLGIKLKWNYKAVSVDLYMPGYIKEALEMFQHPVSTRPKYSPYTAPNTKWVPDSQLTAPKMNPSNYIQQQSIDYNNFLARWYIMNEPLILQWAF